RCSRQNRDQLAQHLLDAQAAVNGFKRVSAQPVTKRHHRDAFDVIGARLRASFISSQRAGGTSNRQLTAMAVDLERNTELGDQHQKLVVDLNAGKQLPCPRDSSSQFVLLGCVRGPKSQGSIIEPLPSLHYFDALLEV